MPDDIDLPVAMPADDAPAAELREQLIAARREKRGEPSRLRGERRRIRAVVLNEIDAALVRERAILRSGGKASTGVSVLEALKTRLQELHRNSGDGTTTSA